MCKFRKVNVCNASGMLDMHKHLAWQEVLFYGSFLTVWWRLSRVSAIAWRWLIGFVY
jgi:hypothetical protein